MVEPITNEEVEEAVAAPEEEQMRLVIWPDEGLKDPVAPFPVENVKTPLVRETAEAMVKAMYHYQGVGLAAQQVGVPFQMFVMDAGWHQEDAEKKPRVFINPRITDIGKQAIQLPHPGEGCLSFPYDYRNPVARMDRLEIEWVSLDGEMQKEWFEGYEAIVIQHEIDHLMGYCFIDRLSRVKRDMALRRARKVRRQYRNGYKRGISQLKHAHKTREYALKRAQAFEQGFKEGASNGGHAED